MSAEISVDGSEGSESTPDSFSKLYEKLYPGANHVSWCSKMDLVAISSWIGGRCKVGIFRSMAWEILHTLEPDVTSKVSSMSWSPDGRNLAVGFENGHIVRFDVESGLPWPTSAAAVPFSSKVTCLRWTKLSTRATLANTAPAQSTRTQMRMLSAPSSGGSLFSMFRDRAHRLIPYIGSLPVKKKFAGFSDNSVATVSSFCGSRSRSDRILRGEADPDEFDVLVAGASSGKVAVFAYGDLLCAELLCVPPDKAMLNIGVADIVVAADFSSLTALLATNKGARSPLPLVQLLVFDCDVLRRHHQPLACAADHLREVWKIHEHMKLSIENAAKSWKDATTPIISTFEKINEAIVEVGSSMQQAPTALRELQNVFACGPTESMVHFFTADKYSEFNSDSALKRMLQTVRQSLDQCQSVLRSHVAKPCNNVVFRLSELRGLARSTEVFEVLGVRVETLTPAITAFERYALFARSVVRHLARTTVQLTSLVYYLDHIKREVADDEGDVDSDNQDDQDDEQVEPLSLAQQEVIQDFLHESLSSPALEKFFAGSVVSQQHRSAFDFVDNGLSIRKDSRPPLSSPTRDTESAGLGFHGAPGQVSDIGKLISAFRTGSAEEGDAGALLPQLDDLAALVRAATESSVKVLSQSLNRVAQVTLPIQPSACHEGRVTLRARVPDTINGASNIGGTLAWIAEDDSDSDDDSDDDDSDDEDSEDTTPKDGPAPLTIPMLEWGWEGKRAGSGESAAEDSDSDTSSDDNEDHYSFEDIISADVMKIVDSSHAAANSRPSLVWCAKVLKGVPHLASSTLAGKPKLAFYGGIPSDRSRNGELLAVLTRSAVSAGNSADDADPGAPGTAASMSVYAYDSINVHNNISGGRPQSGRCHSFMPQLQFVESVAENAESAQEKGKVLDGLPLSSVASLTTCGNRGVAGVVTSDGVFTAFDMEDPDDFDDDDESEDSDDDSDRI